MFSIDNLRHKCSVLEGEIRTLKKHINNCDPSECLVSRKGSGGSFYYYKRSKDADGRRQEKYLPQSSDNEIRRLAYSAYARSRLRDAEAEKKALETLIQFLSKESQVSQLLKKHPGVAAALGDWLSTRNDDGLSASDIELREKAKEWTNRPYKRSTLNPENLKFPTIVPELYVRSKSEADIISRFEYFGVAYHYEEEYEVPEHLANLYRRNGYALHPDFKCRNMRTGNVFWWEHQGKWDDAKYVADLAQRENLLYKIGLIPWKNLIITTETLARPLDLQWVDEIIRFYLL